MTEENDDPDDDEGKRKKLEDISESRLSMHRCMHVHKHIYVSSDTVSLSLPLSLYHPPSLCLSFSILQYSHLHTLFDYPRSQTAVFLVYPTQMVVTRVLYLD